MPRGHTLAAQSVAPPRTPARRTQGQGAGNNSVHTAVVGAAALVVLLVVVTTCKTAPPPAAGASAGTFCGTDLECDDGLVCSCGICALPSGTDDPPLCDATVSCPAFPSACVVSCDNAAFVGDAQCGDDGVEFCTNGVLQSSCDCPQFPTACVVSCENGAFVADAQCGADGVELCTAGVLQTSCNCDVIPPGFQCVNGNLDCISDGNTGCQTNDCADTAFLCTSDCAPDAGNAFVSTCIDHAMRCDLDGSFPLDSCVDGGPVDGGGGPCDDEPRPLCLLNCDPNDFINVAHCEEDAASGDFDWSCSGFQGPNGEPYIPADQCSAAEGEGVAEGEGAGEGEGEGAEGEGEGEGQ